MTYADKPWLKSYFVGPFKLPHTMEPYPEMNVYQFLEDSAKAFPDNIACIYLDEQIIYSELKEKVDRFAKALFEMGVKKGDKIATILPTSIQFIIADYAIMRMGAVHVPLSILHKAPELQHELKESKAEIVICSYRRIKRIQEVQKDTNVKTIIYSPIRIFPDYSLPIIEKIPGTFLLEELIEKNDPNPPSVEINAKDDLALLPFTGGTTGVPKGTMLTHYNLTTNTIQSLQWFLKPLEAGIKGKSTLEVCVPIYHQYGHWIVHGAISWGLKLLLVDARDIKKIVDSINKYRPFGVFGVPTHFMRLAEVKLRRMQMFFFSGAAALPPEVAIKFEKNSGLPMSEGYGMTETSPATHINLSALSKITGFMAEVKRSVGVPIPDTEVKLVDPETGKEVPFGENGEVWIRGPQVMKGYLNAEETPGDGLEDDEWISTGDIGYMDEDGYFYIVDRIKDMINVSGMKVYSRVVDDILYGHPAVREAGIIGLPDPDRLGSERLKAFITLREGASATEEEIINYCKDKLPPYAVPKSVEFRTELPVTKIGKIFKRVLKDEEIERKE